MAANEYTGKRKIRIIAVISIVFTIWLMLATSQVLAALIMIALAVFLFSGNKIARYIFVAIQCTRSVFAVISLAGILTEGSLLSDSTLYYALYLVYGVISIVMLLADKDVKEFYR